MAKIENKFKRIFQEDQFNHVGIDENDFKLKEKSNLIENLPNLMTCKLLI